jgi:hypothetical protein
MSTKYRKINYVFMNKLVSTIFILFLLIVVKSLHAQEISPYLFGQNHWMESGDEGSRPGYVSKLWAKVRESGITMVRIGGNGYQGEFPSRAKLNSMIDSIRAIGAEPLLQVPPNFTDKEATQLVKDYRYANGKGVRFYSIGNEIICDKADQVDKVYPYLIRLAPVMKAADPTIKIFVFDECTMMKSAYEALCGGRLDVTGKDANGNWMIDGFSFHNYPNGAKFDRADVVFSGPYKIREQIIDLVAMMELANKKHNRTGNDELLWALTEVNVTYVNPDREIAGFGNPSFLGGQFIAEIFGMGMQYGSFSVDPWCINEVDNVNTDFGYLGMPSEFYPRSAYYHTQMMALNMKGEFLPSTSSNSFVKTIGSISNDEICIMLLNEDQFHDFNFDIILNKEGISPMPLIVNIDAGLDKKISGSIPNQTTMLFVLSKTGEVKKQYTYGLNHNLKNLKPEVK